MFNKYLCIVLLMCIVYIEFNYSKVIDGNNIVEYSDIESGRNTFLDPQARRRCPLCDSSVYSYCSDKLFHDSCCCNNPNNPHYPLPPQCHFADCSFLHANSCQEHKLITACCCISHLNLFHKK